MRRLSLGILLACVGIHGFANPVQGLYGGMFIGASYNPPVHLTLNSTLFPNSTTDAKLTYDAFGDIGVQVGYRLDHFRFELEPMINYNPFQKISGDGVTIYSPKNSTGLRMKGATTTGALFINGFYNVFGIDNTCSWDPYVGAGIGVAHVNSTIKFYNNNIVIPGTNITETNNAAVAQGIIGIGYFLDDYTEFALDYRYLTSAKLAPFNQRMQVSSINLVFNAVLSCF